MVGKTKLIIGPIVVITLMLIAIFFAAPPVVKSSSSSTENIGALVPENFKRYEAEIRIIFVRAVLGNNSIKDVQTLYQYLSKWRFNSPEKINLIKEQEFAVFALSNRVPYFKVPAQFMGDRKEGDWKFNLEFDLIKSEKEGDVFNDLIAFIPGISKAKCDEVMGEKNIPQLKIDQSLFYNKSMVVTASADYKVPEKVRSLDLPSLRELRTGCFLSHDGKQYVYYSVLLNN